MRVFRLLVRHGCSGLPAGQIATELAVNGTTLSRHLAVMEQAGLVKRSRKAQQLIYSVDFATTRDLFKYLMEDCCAGDPRVLADGIKEMKEGS